MCPSNVSVLEYSAINPGVPSTPDGLVLIRANGIEQTMCCSLEKNIAADDVRVTLSSYKIYGGSSEPTASN